MIRNVACRLASRQGARIPLSAVSSLEAASSRSVSLDSARAPRPKRLSPPPSHSKPRHNEGYWPSLDRGRQKWSSVGKPAPPSDTLEKRLLRPSVLAERLKKLYSAGRLDEAIQMLKNAPLDAQNTIVWNGVIGRTMDEKRYKLAYQLYIDMKRRGFKPTMGTFVTLMHGYRCIEDWSIYTKQLDNVHSLMQDFEQYAESAKRDPVLGRELHPSPINIYIRILGDAREYQKMFDVYNGMDTSGPLAPNPATYGSILHALSERYSGDRTESKEAISAQSASDAKLIWKQVLAAHEHRGVEIDQRVLAGFLRCLTRGRPSDVLFGLDIVHEYCGLSRPGETQLPPKLNLTPPLITAINDLCFYSQKHRLVIHFAQQLMDRAQAANKPCPMDSMNAEQVLRSYACLAALGSMGEADQASELLQWMQRESVLHPDRTSPIRPRLDAYSLVLMACWRGADWTSAVRTMEVLTGCNGTHFLDGYAGTPTLMKRSAKANLTPDVKVLATMVRCAFATQDATHMRQCLRMSDFFNVERMLEETQALLAELMEVRRELTNEEPDDGTTPIKVGRRIRARLDRHDRTFYGSKLATALAECVSGVLPFTPRPSSLGSAPAAAVEPPQPTTTEGARDYTPTEAERTRWLELKKLAMQVNRAVKSLRVPLSGPATEDTPLGDTRSLAFIDKNVDYVMTKRHQNSA